MELSIANISDHCTLRHQKYVAPWNSITRFFSSFAFLFALCFPNVFGGKAWARFVTPDMQKNGEDEEARGKETDQNVNSCLASKSTFLPTQSTQNTREEWERSFLTNILVATAQQVRTHSTRMINSKVHLSQYSTEERLMSLKLGAEESPACPHTSLPVLPVYQSAPHQRPTIRDLLSSSKDSRGASLHRSNGLSSLISAQTTHLLTAARNLSFSWVHPA